MNRIGSLTTPRVKLIALAGTRRGDADHFLANIPLMVLMEFSNAKTSHFGPWNELRTAVRAKSTCSKCL
jgi:hypothetical protein